MVPNKLIAAITVLNMMLPLLSHAEAVNMPATTTTTPSSAPAEISKDTWLNSMTPMLPDLICKGFISDVNLKKRFDTLKMTYEQCVALIPESATKCRGEIYPNIPDKINNESAAVWGKTLGECIGKDFAEKHLVQKQ